MSNGTIQPKQRSVNRATPLKIISELFDYYKGREHALVQLCFSKGVTTNEVADALQVDPALISRNYPRGGKK